VKEDCERADGDEQPPRAARERGTKKRRSGLQFSQGDEHAQVSQGTTPDGRVLLRHDLGTVIILQIGRFRWAQTRRLAHP